MLKKEKNFIIFEREDNKVYKLDINKGQWYGLKGQELSSVPPFFRTALVQYNGDNILIKCLRETVNWNYRSCKSATTEYAENLVMLDMLINFLATIGKELSVTYVSNNEIGYLIDSEGLKKYGKELKTELAKNESKYIGVRTVYYTIQEIERNKNRKKYKLNEDDRTVLGYNEEWLNRFIKDVMCSKNYYPKATEWILTNSNTLNKAIYWYLRECQFLPNRMGFGDMYWVIENLMIYTKPFGKTINDIDKHHFISQYIQWKRDYEANKDKFDNERLAKIDYSKWFFEDDEYITVFPKSKKDFIVEGQKQSNCVGGYADYVLQNHRIVTFIRKKSEIDKPLITCDICSINDRPYINQFLKAHNNHIRQTDEVYEFYKKFNAHINSIKN